MTALAGLEQVSAEPGRGACLCRHFATAFQHTPASAGDLNQNRAEREQEDCCVQTELLGGRHVPVGGCGLAASGVFHKSHLRLLAGSIRQGLPVARVWATGAMLESAGRQKSGGPIGPSRVGITPPGAADEYWMRMMPV